MKTCPECEGDGGNDYLPDAYTSPDLAKYLPCEACDGSGEVDE